MPVVNLVLIALLIVATAFFVATEFAIVKIRPSRVNQLVLENRRNAKALKQVVTNLDGYLSACQLGITITALGLGSLGEPTVEKLLHGVFERLHLPDEIVTLISFAIAFVIITYLHVVVGELAPKSWAIQKAEQVSLMTARPIIFFYKMMYPIIWLLNGSANKFVRLFGLRPAKEHEEAHSEEELRIILSDSYESGAINKTEYGFVNRVFEFDELLAREIMIPRTDMVVLDVNRSFEDNRRLIREEQYTRYPVVRGDKDHIVGMINVKQVLLQRSDRPDAGLDALVHPVMTVSETTPAKTLLMQMQQQRVHMAVLVDEFGGTSGLVTMEDIVEEIFGEIRDEFDAEERPDIEPLPDGRYAVNGKTPLSRVSEQIGADIGGEEWDTVGGWLHGAHPELKNGDARTYGGWTFTVRDKSKHRIRAIEIAPAGVSERNRVDAEPEPN